MQLEKELREYLMWTGQGAFYEDMMQTRRAIREAKLREARRIASRNAFIIDLVLGGLMVTVGIGAIIGMLVIVV